MPKITFLPLNQTCNAQEGESILDIALQNNIPLQHACGGFCACTTCHVHVKSGAESLSSIGEDERERLESTLDVTPQSRLGCQAKIHGNSVVEIQNIDD